MTIYASILHAKKVGKRLSIGYRIVIISAGKLVAAPFRQSIDARKHPDPLTDETHKKRVREILQGDNVFSRYAAGKIEIVTSKKLGKIFAAYLKAYFNA